MDIQKSTNHLCFFYDSVSNQQYELFEQNGCVYKAPVSNVIDPDTGNRIGRFLAYSRMKDFCIKMVSKI